jgi:hypothetical protein
MSMRRFGVSSFISDSFSASWNTAGLGNITEEKEKQEERNIRHINDWDAGVRN